MILVVAGTMARARQIADARAWPRSTWRYVRDGSDIDRQPRADLWLDWTAESHPRISSIDRAVSRALNPRQTLLSLPRIVRGTGTLELKGASLAHA